MIHYLTFFRDPKQKRLQVRRVSRKQPIAEPMLRRELAVACGFKRINSLNPASVIFKVLVSTSLEESERILALFDSGRLAVS